MVPPMRVTNQRINMPSIFLFCFIIHLCLASILPLVFWSLWCSASIQVAPPSHYQLDSQSKTHLPQDQSVFLTTFAFWILLCLFFLIFFCYFFLVTKYIWYQPIKECCKNQFFKECPKQIGLNPAISPPFASLNRKFIVATATSVDAVE